MADSTPTPEQLIRIAVELEKRDILGTPWMLLRNLPPDMLRDAEDAFRGTYGCRRAVALYLRLLAVQAEQATFSNVSSAERGYEDRQIAGVVRASWENRE